ncbi:hypothetical protein [Novosphingobium sp. SG720]|uniref:hypothetical protein n=1 Tax=Novosphingobium sp. SG720 TaxID=2586998 RepID=UPI001445645F|nr:hypothetical protein [Novosphingobium sp. SG720]NKJ40930.1 hypothetical protein [Novosphingobium sp. SG720]
MNTLPLFSLPRLAFAALVLGAVPAHATGTLPPAALPAVELATPPAGVVLAPPRLVRHGDHLAVVTMVRQNVQTAKVQQGQLIARYRASGASAETVAQARCDAHRWQEACTVALTGLGGTSPDRITVAFQPRG